MTVAIIGGGVGGLTSAILLAKQGYDVTLYEKEAHLGGRLTYQSNGKYVIDQGPTIVLLPDLLLEILKECGLDDNEIELIRCDPLYDIHYPDGTVYRKWQDINKQKAEISRVFPGEQVGFDNYITEMEHIYKFGTEAFLTRTFSMKREFLSFENIKFVLASQSYRSVSRYLTRYFQDLRLRDAYALQTLYIGGAPHQAPALYGLISYSEHAFGIWYVKGGYYSLIPKLAALAKRQGVMIKKNTPVTELVIKDNKVKGLVTQSGFHGYSKVVFNGDYPAIEALVKDQTVVKKKLKPSSGCILVYLGLNKRYHETLPHQFYLSEDFQGYMEQVVKAKTLPDDPSCYVFNPITIDPTSAAEGESVLYLLIPVPTDISPSDQELNIFVDQQLDKIEKLSFPKLQDHITWRSIRTPRDAEVDGLFGGGSFGAAPTLNQLGAFRPQVKHPKIKGLFAVGASVHPGGGVPIVMQGARLLVSEMIKGE